jgi:hypothetical protein
MSKTIGNEPAYPGHHLDEDRDFINSCKGMTIRQRFVKAAMQGLLALGAYGCMDGKSIAKISLECADEHLKLEAKTRGDNK